MARCLDVLGADAEEMAAAEGDLKKEMKAVKKAYLRKVLEVHPDKGGSEEAFREVQACFEVLRDLVDGEKVASLAGARKTNVAAAFKVKVDLSAARTTPSWEFYAEAAQDELPPFRVEVARSGRGKCWAKGMAKKCGGDSEDVVIDKGDVRVGRYNEEGGGYGFWVHLDCWRVPYKVWSAFPHAEVKAEDAPDANPDDFTKALEASINNVVLVGFDELDEMDRSAFLLHVMNRDNWARKVVRKPKEEADGEGAGKPRTGLVRQAPTVVKAVHDARAQARKAEAPVATAEATKALAPVRQQYVPPKPGVDGPEDCLAGQTFVLTGLFPEVGGGSGLDVGKERTKALISSFGGRVTGSVSGKTTVLLVGKEPGMSKVSKARGLPSCRLMGLRDVDAAIRAGGIEEVKAEPVLIESFSGGWRGNGLAKHASEAELAIAAGIAEAPEALPPTAKAKAKGKQAKGKRKASAAGAEAPALLPLPPPPPPKRKRGAPSRAP